MKACLDHINKAFESRVRLGIMSALMVNDTLDFSSLKQLLGLTDGNLASHARALEEAGYIACAKQFVGRRPNTTYSATPAGREAFRRHLDALEEFIRQQRQ